MNSKDIFNKINERLIRFINDRENRQSFLIEGTWGTGKTHYLTKIFSENNNNINRIANKKIIYVSCFGLNSIDKLNEKILKELSNTFGKKIKNGLYLFGQFIYKFLSKNDLLNGYKIIKSTIKNESFVLILDDIERSCINFNELFGHVSYLSNGNDSNNIKIICICNTETENTRNYQINLLNNIQSDLSSRPKYDNLFPSIESKLIPPTKEKFKEYIFYNTALFLKNKIEDENFWSSQFKNMKNKIFYDWVNFNNLHKDLSFLFEINSNYLLSIFFEYSSENLVEINYAFKEFSKKEKIKNIRDLTTKIMENYKEIKILIDSLLPCKILTRCIILIFNPSFDKGKKVTQKRFGEHFFPSDFDNPIDDILNFSTEIFVQKIFDDADLPDQIIELCNIYNQLINDKKFINLFSIFSHFLYDTKLTNVEFNICLDSIKSKNTAEKYVNYWKYVFNKVLLMIIYDLINEEDFNQIITFWEKQIIQYEQKIKNKISQNDFNIFYDNNDLKKAAYFFKWLDMFLTRINSLKQKVWNYFESEYDKNSFLSIFHWKITESELFKMIENGKLKEIYTGIKTLYSSVTHVVNGKYPYLHSDLREMLYKFKNDLIKFSNGSLNTYHNIENLPSKFIVDKIDEILECSEKNLFNTHQPLKNSNNF